MKLFHSILERIALVRMLINDDTVSKSTKFHFKDAQMYTATVKETQISVEVAWHNVKSRKRPSSLPSFIFYAGGYTFWIGQETVTYGCGTESNDSGCVIFGQPLCRNGTVSRALSQKLLCRQLLQSCDKTGRLIVIDLQAPLAKIHEVVFKCSNWMILLSSSTKSIERLFWLHSRRVEMPVSRMATDLCWEAARESDGGLSNISLKRTMPS